MHLSNLRLLAVGLAGLDIAVGSPCKPISSGKYYTLGWSIFANNIGAASGSFIATTATTSGLTSFTLSSDSSITVATTTTEAVTPADTTTEVTTVTEADTTTSGDITSGATTFASSAATTETTTEEATVTETVTASTEATTSGGMTSEVTTFATSVATSEETSATGADVTTETTATSDAVTTSAEITEAYTTTEATTTATTVPMFRLVAESGTYANQAIASNRYQGTKLSFNSRSGYPDAFFTVDPTTGYLLLDGTKPICGWTPGDGTSALQVCSDNRSLQEQFITCEAPTSRQLECTVPELFCSMFTQTCNPTGNLWGTTYIGPSGGSGIDTLILGPDYSQGNTAVPLLIVHSSD